VANELVLIVDDNAKNAKLARDLLQAAGFRTLEAGSGSEATGLAHEHRPDVILMDIRLPDMDGTEAARHLKADGRTAQIPIVALTSLTTNPSRLDSTATSRSPSASRSSRTRFATTAVSECLLRVGEGRGAGLGGGRGK
jgi:CheY-like chemotaxis protein